MTQDPSQANCPNCGDEIAIFGPTTEDLECANCGWNNHKPTAHQNKPDSRLAQNWQESRQEAFHFQRSVTSHERLEAALCQRIRHFHTSHGDGVSRALFCSENTREAVDNELAAAAPPPPPRQNAVRSLYSRDQTIVDTRLMTLFAGCLPACRSPDHARNRTAHHSPTGQQREKRERARPPTSSSAPFKSNAVRSCLAVQLTSDQATEACKPGRAPARSRPGAMSAATRLPVSGGGLLGPT